MITDEVFQVTNDFLNRIIGDIYWEEKKFVLDMWYFWDETGDIGGGPYTTREEAKTALKTYCEHL
jgi:hypothetical protein